MYINFVRNNPVLVSIIIFLSFFAIIIISKPGFLFKNDGSLREFGVGYRNKTFLPVWLLSINLGIICYLVVLYYLAEHSFFK